MNLVPVIIGAGGVAIILGGLAVLVFGAAGPDRAPVEGQP